MVKVKIFFDRKRIRSRRELPAHMRGSIRKLQRDARKRYSAYNRRITATGAALSVIRTNFTAHVDIFGAGSGTETCPWGAASASVAVWASGGSGSAGTGTGCGANNGGGGGSGSRGFTSGFSVVGKNGLTWSYTAASGGVPSGIAGAASSVTAGTMTGWTAINTNGGGAGVVAGGAGGTAGTGGTTSNTAGNAGQSVAGGGAGGAGLGTVITGDGAPYGQGGNGGVPGAGHPGQAGGDGACVFSFA